MSKHKTTQAERDRIREARARRRARVPQYGRLANPTAADPARGSFMPKGSRRERRKR